MNDKTFTRHSIAKETKFNCGDNIFNYNELIDLVDCWHKLFSRLGLKKGDCIAIYEHQTIEHFAAFVAIAEQGMTYCGLQSNLFNDPDTLFNPAEFGITAVLIGTDLNKIAPCFWKIMQIDIDSVHSETAGIAFQPLCEPGDYLIESMTSGSTGEPKRFCHTHKSLMIAAAHSARLFYSTGQRALIYSSFNHVGVVSVNLLPTMMAGCYIIANRIDSSDRYNFWDLLEKYQPEICLIFPYTLEFLRNDPRWETHRLSFITDVISGGTLIPKEFVTALLDKGIKKIHNVYGLSEALPPLFVNTIDQENIEHMFDDNGQSPMGLRIPGCNYKVIDNTLYVKTPSFANSNWIQRRIGRDGFIATGDIVRKVGDTLYYVGRLDRTARLYDMLVNLSKFEEDAKKVVPDIDGCFATIKNDQLILGIKNFNNENTSRLLLHYPNIKVTSLEELKGLDQIKPITVVR